MANYRISPSDLIPRFSFNPSDLLADRKDGISWYQSLKLQMFESTVRFMYKPKNIYYDEKTGIMVVLWLDGTKTKVKPMKGAELSKYAAYTACLAKKIHGSNANVCRIVDDAKPSGKKSKVKKDDNTAGHKTKDA